MEVNVDRDECISCATCWSICPEFFEENLEDGLCQVVLEYRLGDSIAAGEAPEDMDCVQEAADLCPVEIIHVES